MVSWLLKELATCQEPEPSTDAIVTPIFQTSTYAQSGLGEYKGFEYSRSHNPTRTALEAYIAALEDGQYGLAFASGMVAEHASLKCFLGMHAVEK
ncbi:MAG: hypothetical protein NVS4B12_26640 [Ktedonobacteraceae bacterium]